MPESVQRQLQHACRRNAIRNRLFQRELVGIAEHLGASRIPLVPLKGVALADRLYGDISYRVCSDIDVLVPRHAVIRAVAVLGAEDYLPEHELWSGPNDMDLFLDSDIEAGFRCRNRAAAPLIDLHWDVARRWRADGKAIDDLWAEASPAMLWGIGTCRLSPEWEVLYLAVHAVRHRWRDLKWLVDIHDCCSLLHVDWNRLGAKAERFGWGKALRLTLSICHALLGTDVPQAQMVAVPRWAFRQLHGSDGAWKDSLIPARVLDRRADRLRYLLRLFLMPTILERRAVRLPVGLSHFYRVLRPLRLATRWGTPVAASALKAWRSR
jgi:hypothetical protein